MENTEKILVLVRKFFFKWFIIGLFLFILQGVIFIFNKDFIAGLGQSMYGVDASSFMKMAIMHFMLMKAFLLLGVLAPALAVHWLIHCCREKY